jgi:hypothetical protein
VTREVNKWETAPSKEQVGFFSKTATTKYVRREIRSLKDDDRDKYFEALQDMLSMDQNEGEAMYGKNFLSLAEATALHTSSYWKYHNNLFFSTSHPVLQLKFEKSLLAVAGKSAELVLPYW